MRKFEKRIPLATPTIHREEQLFVKEAFDTNWVAPLGANVDAFEEEVCKHLSVNSALACVSGTSALFLAYKSAGVKAGDIVFCSDMTFAATANPICYLGAKPVFIDSEKETWNMCPVALEKAFKKYPQCKVVGLAHLYGTPAKLDEIKAVCKKYGAVLVEDAAESLSATYKGKQTGSFGEYNIISFNGNKLITTSGGGMLLSDNEEAIKKARFWSTQSRDAAPWYQHSELGFNFRLSNVCAGIGRGQLLHIEEHKAKKTEIYHMYKEAFKELPVTMNPYLKESVPNFWLSCITVNEGCKVKPMDIYDRLNEFNVESRPIWKPMHMQPFYAENDFIIAEENAVNEDIFRRGLCLPSDIKMTKEEQLAVINIIKSCF